MSLSLSLSIYIYIYIYTHTLTGQLFLMGECDQVTIILVNERMRSSEDTILVG